MIEDHYLSFHFDTTVSPVIYGVCVWTGSVTWDNQNTNIQITLDDTLSGVLKLRDLAVFVSDLSKTRLTKSVNDRIILDKSPDMTALQKELKKTSHLNRVEVVERVGSITEQTAKYSMMFDRDRFFIGDFLVEPDLIFDELANINLIDPIIIDEQTVFPMTQALLVGCHYLETVYRFYPGAIVGGKLNLPDFGADRFKRS